MPLFFRSKTSSNAITGALHRIGHAQRRTSYAADSVDRARLVDAALQELKNAPPKKRVQLVKKANLPAGAAKLGPAVSPLFAFMLDDDGLRAQLGDATVRTWLQADGRACAAHVLARAERLPPSIVVLVLASGVVEPSEVFDVLAPMYRSSSEVRAVVTHGFFPGAPSTRSMLSDPRFVELALETLALHPESSCSLLGAHGSPRAIDELKGIVERARSASEPMLLAALEGLQLALAPEAHAELLATLLSTSPLFTTSSASEIAGGPLSIMIGHHAFLLRGTPRVQGDARLQEIVERCDSLHMMVPAGE